MHKVDLKKRMSDNPKFLLKTHLILIKETFKSLNLKITKPTPTTFNLNFIVEEESMVDIFDLDITIIIEDLEKKITKLILNSDLPPNLHLTIQTRLQKSLNQYQSHQSWVIDKFIKHVYDNFEKIVYVPECLEVYMGEGQDGQSVRRFAIKVDETLSTQTTSEDDESEDDDDEEAREYWRLKKLEEEEKILRIKAEEAEEKRVAYQNDPSLHAKVKVLSIKEQKEQKEARNKQGWCWF